jgi:hypothetical protein
LVQAGFGQPLAQGRLVARAGHGGRRAGSQAEGVGGRRGQLHRLVVHGQDGVERRAVVEGDDGLDRQVEPVERQDDRAAARRPGQRLMPVGADDQLGADPLRGGHEVGRTVGGGRQKEEETPHRLYDGVVGRIWPNTV